METHPRSRGRSIQRCLSLCVLVAGRRGEWVEESRNWAVLSEDGHAVLVVQARREVRHSFSGELATTNSRNLSYTMTIVDPDDEANEIWRGVHTSGPLYLMRGAGYVLWAGQHDWRLLYLDSRDTVALELPLLAAIVPAPDGDPIADVRYVDSPHSDCDANPTHLSGSCTVTIMLRDPVTHETRDLADVTFVEAPYLPLFSLWTPDERIVLHDPRHDVSYQVDLEGNVSEFTSRHMPAARDVEQSVGIRRQRGGTDHRRRHGWLRARSRRRPGLAYPLPSRRVAPSGSKRTVGGTAPRTILLQRASAPRRRRTPRQDVEVDRARLQRNGTSTARGEACLAGAGGDARWARHLRHGIPTVTLDVPVPSA